MLSAAEKGVGGGGRELWTTREDIIEMAYHNAESLQEQVSDRKGRKHIQASGNTGKVTKGRKQSEEESKSLQIQVI